MDKVVLRAMEPEDLDFLYQIENDRAQWGVGVTNVPYSRYLLHDFIANSSGDIYKDGQVRLMIDNEAGETVGMADLMNFDARHCRAEVGIVIAPAHRCKGYAVEALQQLADYARRVLHLHQLYAVVALDNAASVSLFTRLHYQQTAQLSDWLYDGTDYHSARLFQYIL